MSIQIKFLVRRTVLALIVGYGLWQLYGFHLNTAIPR